MDWPNWRPGSGKRSANDAGAERLPRSRLASIKKNRAVIRSAEQEKVSIVDYFLLVASRSV